MRLSLLSIMLNEEALVPRWLEGVRRVPGLFKEVVVLDGGSTDGTLRLLDETGITAVLHAFPGNFAAQRNTGIDLTHGEWIFELDADEIASAPLLVGLRQIIGNADRDGVDCIGIARLNFHDDVLQQSPGHRGLDYQYRLHRRHVRWHGRVHEEPIGFTRRVELDLAEGFFLLHMKTAARHEERNALYQRIMEREA